MDDEQIERVILTRLRTAGASTNASLRAACGFNGAMYEPQVDKALQRLRKRGEIQATTRGWEISGTVACKACKGTGRVRK